MTMLSSRIARPLRLSTTATSLGRNGRASPSPSLLLSVRSQIKQHRQLHLAPPFLLDDYIPRYQLLSEVDASKKRSLTYAHLRNCNLCPRLCGVNRYETTGMCLIGENVKVNVIAPHFGEGMSLCPFSPVIFFPSFCSVLLFLLCPCL
jgi:uncharacterized Fe-S radical SAM superfamily protein PflX